MPSIRSPPSGLGILTRRLRTITVLDKLARDLRPALFENRRQLLDGHAVNPRRSFVAHDRLRGRLDVLHVADRLH
jgi:hypothetical protein